MKRLSLNKEIISNITKDEMNKMVGGSYDAELFHSRVCGTYFNGGGCGGDGNSKSCADTVLLCFPF